MDVSPARLGILLASMSAEASSGIRLQVGQQIGEYQVEEVLESGANALPAAPDLLAAGFFLKSTKIPGGPPNGTMLTSPTKSALRHGLKGI